MTLTGSIVGSTNAGYTIIEQGKNAVIARSNSIPDYYVAWNYWCEKGVASYAWGRYGSYEYAKECFTKKEIGEYSG